MFIVPESWRFPGMGILSSMLIILGVGFLLNNFLTVKLFTYVEAQFSKVPFVKTIYGPLKDLMGLFASNSNENMKRVVLVEFPQFETKLMGLVTRDSFSDVPEMGIGEDKISVYIPGSYILGGVTVLVPRTNVTELDIPVDRAMKLAITGWIHSKNQNNIFDGSF